MKSFAPGCALLRSIALAIALSLSLAGFAAPSQNLAPGFASLQRGATVLIMPPDIELFSVSAGGVPEPKADWTETATGHILSGLRYKSEALGMRNVELSEKDADDLAEINTLHAAVARSIALHHFQGGNFSLPTKGGQLDWSLGEAVKPLQERSGASYALFVWVRDSYASAERKAAMVAMALLGIGVPGGFQIGYASLVNLHTGQILWFNRLQRGTGDLRTAADATETVTALLDHFPGSQ